MRRKPARSKGEPTTALINIVFLMLIFFLVAGTLAAPLDQDLTLVDTRDLEQTPPATALVIHADGRLTYRGEDMADAAAYITRLSPDDLARVRLVPDRELPASDLVRLGRDLRKAGAETVVVVTERGLE
ncbi:ExbD/TolR family protein [Sagittula sp. SSi028]|uniref:ExbD/TolR family protein n=1 Tax=Sagittula sp. SSi028 TaxID=3400636 RepID=UPI003AF95329